MVLGLLIVGIIVAVAAVAVYVALKKAEEDARNFPETPVGEPETPCPKAHATNKGVAVETIDDAWPDVPDMTQEEADNYLSSVGLKDKVTQTAPPTDTYDCHGYTFTGGETWINNDQVDQILNDNGYSAVMQPTVGDVIAYRDSQGEITHTGIVREVQASADGTTDVTVESKWGRLGRYEHAPGDVPPGYGTPQYYHTDRPNGHLLQQH